VRDLRREIPTVEKEIKGLGGSESPRLQRLLHEVSDLGEEGRQAAMIASQEAIERWVAMGANTFKEHMEQYYATTPKMAQCIPDVMKAFGELHKASAAEGALSTKHKELISVAIAVVIRCEPCIAFHVHDALKAGATRQEIAEAIGVAIGMGGGPAAAYGAAAMRAVEEFEQA